ncbi:MAG: hypothetical protein A2X08_06050 [Bacteroidetes bacterium GWA2_32_17]|nr:MAG: hypothetical protein A2X08_06050 [Bacteroidetes bacterium GWA2_32_17]
MKSIRFIAGNIIGSILTIKPVNKHRLKLFDNSGSILSVYFHNPNYHLFEQCVKWLVFNKFEFISLDEVAVLVETKKKVKTRKAVITLDDGWKDNLNNVLPVIEKYKIPVTIFISIAPVYDGNLWTQVFKNAISQKSDLIKKEEKKYKKIPEQRRLEIYNLLKQNTTLKRNIITIEELLLIVQNPLIYIGGHTFNHAMLNICTLKEQQFEIDDSKKHLEKIIGKQINYFAYPNGDYNDDSIQLVSKAGYRMAFTTKSVWLRPDKYNTPFILPRICIPNNLSFNEAKMRLLGML